MIFSTTGHRPELLLHGVVSLYLLKVRAQVLDNALVSGWFKTMCKKEKLLKKSTITLFAAMLLQLFYYRCVGFSKCATRGSHDGKT